LLERELLFGLQYVLGRTEGSPEQSEGNIEIQRKSKKKEEKQKNRRTTTITKDGTRSNEL
jgi:hypothetical protein